MAQFGPYLVEVPVLSDSELIFNEAETREILTFFYPTRARDVTTIPIDDQGRAFAQIMLTAAIDMTMAMGVIEATFKAIYGTAKSKNKSIWGLIKRLAKQNAKMWYKHARKGKKPEDADIYYTVRDSVALAMSSPVQAYINGDREVASKFLSKPSFFHIFA